MARKLFKRFSSAADGFLASAFMQRMGPRLERMGLQHPNIWHLNRHSAAGAVAVGLATGLIPGPLQMLTAAIVALLFRVNLPVALVTTLYTNPFTIVPLYILAYSLGGLVTGESVKNITVPEFDWSPLHLSDTIRQAFDWLLSLGNTLLIGLAIESVLFAFIGYFLVQFGWRMFVIYEWRKRCERRASRTHDT